jgi:hypothetical protein
MFLVLKIGVNKAESHQLAKGLGDSPRESGVARMKQELKCDKEGKEY